MNETECPYCHEMTNIHHDDGQGFEEDYLHEQECDLCEKTFVFTTSVSYYYSPKKANCLNEGGEHVMEPSVTFPRFLTTMLCQTCSYRREPTPEERTEYEIPDTPEKYK